MRTPEQVAVEVERMIARGASMPRVLLEWVARRDPDEVPPALQSGYDLGTQRCVISNEIRLRSHYGLLDGSRAPDDS